MKWSTILLVFFQIFTFVLSLEPFDNPYEILGIRKSASIQDVRKSYKKLAKEWHPDKNSDPAAANRFVQITQAYELLTDPERRKLFDNHGIINPDSNPRTRRDYQFDFDPFDDLFGYQFPARDPDITLFHKLSITTRAFENNLLPNSVTTPCLVLFYSDWCFSCLKIEPLWRKIVEDLEPIGVEVATVHSENEAMLTKKCGVATLPSLVLLIDGKHYLYREHSFSIHRVVEFIRSKFPYRIIQTVTDDNVDEFLAGWSDNRVRALVSHRAEVVRLRYLLTAFHYRDRISFGFVRLGSENTKEIQKRYKISPETETLLLFNENPARPVASLSMTVIPVQTMRDIIAANKYLMLPRLSSQPMLDAVCPVEWARPRKRLCVVLVSKNTGDHDEARQAMRRFIQEGIYNNQRVHFSYIYQEKQTEFMETLAGTDIESRVLNVVILWRKDVNRVKFEWLPGRWNSHVSPQWNETKKTLESTIARLLRTDQSLTSEALVKPDLAKGAADILSKIPNFSLILFLTMPTPLKNQLLFRETKYRRSAAAALIELIDEHAQGLVGRLLTRFLIATDVLRESFKWDYFLAISTIIGTTAAIVAGGYFMAYLVRLEEEKIRTQEANCGNNNNNKTNGSTAYTPQLKVHELRAEKYNGMVRLLKPGCRTIILLVDQQSKSTLLPAFHKAVWPYRKNKTLMFGFMFIERGIEWYTRVLTLSLPEPRQLNINPRNCIGTVLCLNGHRKYFCMYHAKHPECSTRGSKRMMRMTKTLSDKNDSGRIGGFMGFGESSDSDSDGPMDVEAGTKVPLTAKSNEDEFGNIIFQSNLLDGLQNWLDRLFEGTTHRYYINYWPDFPTK